MFHSKASSSKLPKRGWKPRLEILEDRCVPATRTWDGGALTNNWTNANNWANNIAPVAGDDLVFPAGNFDKTADNDYTPGTHFRSISVGGGYTLRGNRIFLGEGGVIDNSGTSNAIKNDLDLGNVPSRNFQIGSGSTLFLDGVISGGSGLTKLGAGNLSLRRNNTYTGITSINAGGLFIEKDESLGQGVAGTNIFTGAMLVVNDTALGAIRTDENLFVQHNGTIRGINDVELRGNITTLGTALLKHDGSIIESMKISGVISGAGGISVLPGTGKVRFIGNTQNLYQGTTTVSGELILARDTVSIPGDLNILSGGLVRHDNKDNQIANSAIVTINGTGRMELDASVDIVDQLIMNGGSLRTVANSFLEEFVDMFDLDAEAYGELTILSSFVATSFNGTTAAFLDRTVITLPATNVLTVLDGPAVNDLIFEYSSIEGNHLVKRGTGVMKYDVKIDDNDVLIEEGTFINVQHTDDSRITVRDGGRFVSDKRIAELVVESGGRVKPGQLNSTGTLQINGNLTLEPGAIVEAVFNGSSFDQLDVDGNVNINDAILEATLGSNAVVGQTYKLINNSASDSILGAFFLPPVNAPFLIASPTGQRLAFNYAGGLGNNDLILTLQNTPPKAPDLALNTTEINEGGTVTATGKLVDPDTKDALRLFINWGDGSRQEIYRPGLKPFQYSHSYRRDGVYTARFEWLDQSGQGNSREFTITVNNVAPALKLRTLRTTASGILLLSGWLSDAGDDRYTATLDFGDGSSRSKTPKRRDFFAVAHRYKNPGTYTLTLTLRDAQGAEQQYQREIVIS